MNQIFSWVSNLLHRYLLLGDHVCLDHDGWLLFGILYITVISVISFYTEHTSSEVGLHKRRKWLVGRVKANKVR